MQKKTRTYRGRTLHFKFGFCELHILTQQVNEGRKHIAIASLNHENSSCLLTTRIPDPFGV